MDPDFAMANEAATVLEIPISVSSPLRIPFYSTLLRRLGPGFFSWILRRYGRYRRELHGLFHLIDQRLHGSRAQAPRHGRGDGQRATPFVHGPMATIAGPGNGPVVQDSPEESEYNLAVGKRTLAGKSVARFRNKTLDP